MILVDDTLELDDIIEACERHYGDADQFLADYDAGTYPGDINADMFANLLSRAYVNGRESKDVVVSEDNNPLKDGWMTLDKAAEMYKYNKEQLRRLCKDDAIKCARVGFMWLVYGPSIQDYIDGPGYGPYKDRETDE